MNKTSISLVLALTLSSADLAAQVYVNGVHYTGAALYQLEQAYGGQIPPGNYWLLQNGNWGYVGSDLIQGNFHTDNQVGAGRQNGGYVDVYPGSGAVVKDGNTGCTYYDLGGISYNTCDGF